MAHVRVQRFAARHDQKYRAKHRESDEAVRSEERNGMARIEGAQHRRQSHDPDEPKPASVTNQMTMIGPNRPPTRCVPYF